MTQVVQYYARGRPPARSARSPANYPYRASIEYSAMARFGAGLAGVLDDEVKRRHDILVQNEYSIGKTAFVQDLINAQEEFRKETLEGNADFDNWVERYRKRTERVQKEILDQAVLPSSKQRLTLMMRDATPGNVAAISDLAWDGKLKHQAAIRELNVENYKELIANTPSDDVAGNLMAKMIADIIENPLLTPQEAQLAAREAEQDALRRRAPIVTQRQTDSIVEHAKTLSEKDAFAFLSDQTGLTSAQRSEVRSRLGLYYNLQNEEIQAQAEAASNDYIQKIEKGESAEELVSDISADARIDSTEKRTLIRWVTDRAEALGRGDKDPLVSTHNYEIYWEDYKKAIDGKITEPEARSHVGKDGYAINQYKEIVNILTSESTKGKANEVESVMKEMDGFFDDMIIAGGLPEDKQRIRAAKLKARQILKTRVDDSIEKEKPLGGFELIEEMLRVQREIERQLEAGTPEETFIPTRRKATGWQARDRLQAVWEQMNETERETAMRALRRGKTPEEIIEYFNKNK